MGKMAKLTVFALLSFALQMNVAFAAPPMPTSEVLIHLGGYNDDNDPVADLEKTSVDEWGGYKADGQYSKENQTIKFYPVPRGTFHVWIMTWNCGIVEGDFTFGEGVKKTEITFDASECRFTQYSFSQ